MKALVYDGPEVLTFRDMPDPDVPKGYHLVKIMSSGICGSDMHAYLGHDERRPAPLILGHEAAGVIVGGVRDGECVTINPLNANPNSKATRDGRDNLCPDRRIISMPPREGAFAEYVAIPDANLITVPDGFDLDAASLAEPVACGWHTVRLCRENLGQDGGNTALIIGGGPIGVGAALSAVAMGFDDVKIAEPNAIRQAYLRDACGLTVISPDALNDADQYDMVVDGVGYEATRATASAHTRPGGVIGHIGLGSSSGGLDIRRMTLQEITFIGTYTYTAQDFRDCAQAMFDGRLGDLTWTEARPLEDGHQAFEDIRAGRVAVPKIILKPNG